MKSPALTLLALLCLGGCVPMGGRTVHVTINTEPAGAEVFMVPRLKWDAHGGPAFLNSPELETFQIGGSQRTPFVSGVYYDEQILVVRRGDRVEWKEVTPDEGQTLFLRFTQPGP